jgi:hypothetical protein
MAKQPKPLDKMTKPELVKALKAAYKRIAKLENDRLEELYANSKPVVFPWQQVLNDTKGL